MTSYFYTQGQQAALKLLGLDKTAALPGIGALGRLGRSAGQWLKQKGPATREFLVGNPRRFAEEVAAGKALGKGSLLRESFKVDSPYMKALLFGMPVVEAGSIIADQEGRKGQRLGETLGGTALGLAAWRPFGMVGSMAADTLGRQIGKAVGQTGEYVSRGGAPETLPSPAGGALPEVSRASQQLGRAAGTAQRLRQNNRFTA